MKIKSTGSSTLHKLWEGHTIIWEPGEVKEVSEALGLEMVRSYGFEALDAEDVKPKRRGRPKG